MLMLIATSLQIQASDTTYNNRSQEAEENPTPAFIQRYRQESPCIGTLCCSSNPKHHEFIQLSLKASPCLHCILCQVRPIDPYNTQRYKWDGTCLDTTQSYMNFACYVPKRIAVPSFTVCCFLPWYYNTFKPNYPNEFAWHQSHQIDYKNRKIIKKSESENMKRD
jgi:hypothetical protein